jgi:opacity protein-like surface antigen
VLEDYNEYFNRATLGLNVGVNYNFSEKWFIDARYVHRFSGYKYFVGNHDNEIQQIRLGVGYRF